MKSGSAAKTTRLKMKLNQTEFWHRVGVTQSGGSRYENDSRGMPSPVQTLLLIAYGKANVSAKIVKTLRGE